MRSARLATMLGWHFQLLLVRRWPAADCLKQVSLRRVARFAPTPLESRSRLLHVLIHTPIIGRPDHKVRVLVLTLQKEGVDVTVAISHMHPQHPFGWCSDGLHRSFPHL